MARESLNFQATPLMLPLTVAGSNPQWQHRFYAPVGILLISIGHRLYTWLHYWNGATSTVSSPQPRHPARRDMHPAAATDLRNAAVWPVTPCGSPICPRVPLPTVNLANKLVTVSCDCSETKPIQLKLPGEQTQTYLLITWLEDLQI